MFYNVTRQLASTLAFMLLALLSSGVPASAMTVAPTTLQHPTLPKPPLRPDVVTGGDPEPINPPKGHTRFIRMNLD